MKTALLFTLGKYLNYILLFVRGILLASAFDYSTYASWGIVMYVLSYFAIFGFGIPNIVLTKLKDYEFNGDEFAKIVGSSVLFVIYLSVIYLFGVFMLENIGLLGNSRINYYFLVLLVVLYLVIDIFRNVARYSDRYRAIWASEFFAATPLLLLLIFKPIEPTLNLAVGVLTVSSLGGLLFLLKGVKLVFDFQDFRPYLKQISKLGIPLLVFNYSSYLLFVLLRYFVLESYDDITISNFNFGWLIANAIILGISVVNWYFYPTLLKNLSGEAKLEHKITQKETFASQFLIAALILTFCPIIFEFCINNFFLKYEDSILHFKYLLTCQLIFYLAYFPSTFLIVKEKNKALVISGLLASAIYAVTVWTKYSLDGRVDLFLLYSVLIISAILFYVMLSYSVEWKGSRWPYFLALSTILLLAYFDNIWVRIAAISLVAAIMLFWKLQVKSLVKKIKHELSSI